MVPPCYLDTEWIIQQRLIRPLLLSKSLTGEVTPTVLSTLSTEYGISSDFLTAAIRDRALINQVVINTLGWLHVAHIGSCRRQHEDASVGQFF